MEPISTLFFAALTGGAAGLISGALEEADAESYQTLKRKIISLLGDKADLAGAMTMVDGDPNSATRKALLQEELDKAVAADHAIEANGDLRALAQSLLNLLSQRQANVCADNRSVAAGGDMQGNTIITGDRNVSVGTNSGNIATGDGVRQIKAGTYVENQNITQIDPAQPDPSKLRTAYLERMMEETGALPLGGIDPIAAGDGPDGQITLNAVYTALLTIEAERNDLHGVMGKGEWDAMQPTPEQMHKLSRAGQGGEGADPISAIDQLNRHQTLVLLGDPGSGKSTFVNFVALCMAGANLTHPVINLDLLTAPLPAPKDKDPDDPPQPQPWNHGPLLPVRVILRDFAAQGLPADGSDATADHVWTFIITQLTNAALGDYAPYLRDSLLTDGGLILFDGLDEVAAAEVRRRQIKAAIQDFAKSFGRCRILVTSRTYAYQKQDWRLHGFEETILAPFTDGQIRSFVDRWYAQAAEQRTLTDRQEQLQDRAELLKQAIFNRERLHELAQRPLLLTLMASLHAWRGGNLPERREELYADAVDLLLDRWERQRMVQDTSSSQHSFQPSLAEFLRADREQIKRVLSQLAFDAHRDQPELVGEADIKEGDLVAGLMRIRRSAEANPALLLEYLSDRAGLLVPRGVGIYSFPHRTFQEYLAAAHLTDVEYPDKLAELVRAEPNRWREVTLLAGAKGYRGTASAIWNLVDALCYRESDSAQWCEADDWGALLAGEALTETVLADMLPTDAKIGDAAGKDGEADKENDGGPNWAQIGERYQRKLTKVKEGLLCVMTQSKLPSLERAAAGRHLAALGDPRPKVMGLRTMPFCYIPAGPFEMGLDDEGDAQKHTNQTLDYPYWISRFPVTNAQFKHFVKAGGYQDEQYWAEAIEAKYWGVDGVAGGFDSKPRQAPLHLGYPFEEPNHPVVGVMWYEALAFTRWLTDHLRAQGLPPEWTVTLPSEAQWEKAARGGHKIPVEPLVVKPQDNQWNPSQDLKMRGNPDRDRRFPWIGDIAPMLANYEQSEIGSTSAVGCFRQGASPYGVEELSGNVYEWTRSLWGSSYPYESTDGREKLDADERARRVIRGGWYGDNGSSCSGSSRCWIYPDYWYDNVGFRMCVVPIPSVL